LKAIGESSSGFLFRRTGELVRYSSLNELGITWKFASGMFGKN
jgi:hypothetical protein